MRVISLSALFICVQIFCQPTHADYSGWQSMRVIRQEGNPRILRCADLDADGRQELIVVNGRSSRLDIYSWLDEASRDAPETPSKNHPNELPMAPDLRHRELQCERVPQDVVIRDIDGDGQLELIVLVSPPNQIQVYCQEESGTWQKNFHIDLLDGEVSSRHRSLLVRRGREDQLELMVSMKNGIQQVALQPGGRAVWLTPREQRDRKNWWLADLDGDGFDDLVEQSQKSSEAIRWYRGSATQSLAPAAVLHDRSVHDVEVLSDDTTTQLMLLDGSVRELLKRYHLEVGQPSPFGLQRPLAFDDSAKTAWCGMWQGSNRVLVTADPDGPRLRCYALGETGWGEQQGYPAVSDIQSVAAPAAEPGLLLIWAKDAADLLTSRWDSQRLSYPRSMPQSDDVEGRKILALGTVGSVTWWVQKVDKHLDLYRWEKGQTNPELTRFEDVSSKADEVLWIGGDRLLVKDTHSRGIKLAVHSDDKTVVSSPTHLKKADLDEYKLIAVADGVRLGRLTEGVLQWIGDDLRSEEQVMLPPGQQLADYIAAGDSGGWALQKGSPFIQKITIEPSGLSQVSESVKVIEGSALVNEPVLGVVLVDHNRIIHLSEGRPHELKLIDAVDKRVGRSGGVRETKFHRLDSTDVDGDGVLDLVVYDDMEHRITVMADDGGTLKPKISWPVFDDKVYPYGSDYENLVHEPRAIAGLDLDGDQHQDLALLCHDRLILYLAREEREEHE